MATTLAKNQKDGMRLAETDIALCFASIIKHHPSLTSDSIAWLARFMNKHGLNQVRITQQEWMSFSWDAGETKITQITRELEYAGILVKLLKRNTSPTGETAGTYRVMYINKNCY